MKFLLNKTNALIGYTQSDEISLISPDTKNPIFNGSVSKLNSVIILIIQNNELIYKYYLNKPLTFMIKFFYLIE